MTGRVSSSMLTTIGLLDLVTESEEEYMSTAVTLATNATFYEINRNILINSILSVIIKMYIYYFIYIFHQLGQNF